MEEEKKPNRRVRLTIESRLENVPLIGMAVNRLCSLIPFSETEASRMELCVVEAVNNSIFHAYGSQAGHAVEAEFSLFSDRLVLRVFDTGSPMSDARIHGRARSSLELDAADVRNIPESGRGIGIIQSIMDDVSYRTDSERNCLTMVKKITVSKKVKS
jgi:serine/threonine-protein kinase RsbW